MGAIDGAAAGVSSPIIFEGSPANGDDPIALLFKKFTRLVETDRQVCDALPIDEIAALAGDTDDLSRIGLLS
jgi:hypothetical protein